MAKNSLQLIKKTIGIPEGLKRERGTVKLTIRADRFARVDPESHEVQSFLHFRDAGNWWAIEPAIGPDSLLELYGRKLAIDFLEYATLNAEDEGELAQIISSMPAKKGAIELGFIAEIEHLARWMANANH